MGLERLPIARSGRVSGVKVAASAISGPLRAPLVHALVALVLFGWAFTVFDGARSRTTFHPDESDWIATGRLFGYLFLRGDLKHEVWNGGYYMLAQPPGFRYAFRAGLWLQGHDLNTLNQTYRFDGDLEANRREGRVPTGAVLMDARKVAILFAASAVALLYVVAVQLGTPLAGIAAALLAGASPYLQTHFVRAMAEAPFGFFLLATLAVCLATVRRSVGGFGVGYAMLAIPALGLALATKAPSGNNLSEVARP